MKQLKCLLSLILALSLHPIVPVQAAGGGFTDIPSTSACADAVNWCVSQGLMNGVGNNRFEPDGVLTRATLATVLYRAEGSPSVTDSRNFSDVRAGQWYTNGILWAAKEGYITGYGGGRFGTNDPVTRVQLDIIVRRYQGENPSWPGDPTKRNAARSEVAEALYHALASQTPAPETHASRQTSGKTLNVRFGDSQTFTLNLYSNQTAEDIYRHVGTSDWNLPIYNFDNYEGWEVFQYYDVSTRYDITDLGETITSEKGGEVYYSHPNRIILFYGDAQITSEYTPVGYISFNQTLVDAVKDNPVLPGWGNSVKDTQIRGAPEKGAKTQPRKVMLYNNN